MNPSTRNRYPLIDSTNLIHLKISFVNSINHRAINDPESPFQVSFWCNFDAKCVPQYTHYGYNRLFYPK